MYHISAILKVPKMVRWHVWIFWTYWPFRKTGL